MRRFFSLSERRGADNRQHSRRDVRFLAASRRIDQPDTPIEVENFSAGGFRAVSEDPIPVGADLFIKIPEHGWRLAHVRWARNGRIGANFVYALPDDAMDLPRA